MFYNKLPHHILWPTQVTPLQYIITKLQIINVVTVAYPAGKIHRPDGGLPSAIWSAPSAAAGGLTSAVVIGATAARCRQMVGAARQKAAFTFCTVATSLYMI